MRQYLAGADACLYRHEGYIGKREKKSLGVVILVSLLVGLLYADDSLRIIDTGASIMLPTLKWLPKSPNNVSSSNK